MSKYLITDGNHKVKKGKALFTLKMKALNKLEISAGKGR